MTRRVASAGVSVVCVVVLLLGAVLYVRLSRDLNAQDDQQLSALASRPMATLLRPGSTVIAQLRSAGGVLLLQTPALTALGALPAEPAGYANVSVAGTRLRVFSRKLAGAAMLSVAADTTGERLSLRRVRRELVSALLVGGLLAAGALIFVTRKALEPVRHAADVADQVANTNDLTARVPEPDGDDNDEPVRLARSMNRMLERLQTSDTALRRLISDASHELRSPVTTLRGNLELLTGAVAMSQQDRAAALRDALAETRELGDLIEALLSLARADAAPTSSAMTASALVEELPAEQVTIATDTRDATIFGDLVTLRALTRNLTQNAERYAGGWEASLSSDPANVYLRIIDHGPGIAAPERSRVFERFARGEAAAGKAGSGLGLAIVEATARAHGGDVRITDTPGGGATFTVRLPRQDSAQHAT